MFEKFGNPKLAKRATVIFLALLMFVGLAYAIYTLTIPSTVTVTEEQLGLYGEEGCITPITAISWGNVPKGLSSTKTYYLKNTGTITFSSLEISSNLEPAVGTITWNATEGLTVGQVKAVNITITITSTAIVGFSSFNIIVTGIP